MLPAVCLRLTRLMNIWKLFRSNSLARQRPQCPHLRYSERPKRGTPLRRNSAGRLRPRPNRVRTELRLTSRHPRARNRHPRSAPIPQLWFSSIVWSQVSSNQRRTFPSARGPQNQSSIGRLPQQNHPVVRCSIRLPVSTARRLRQAPTQHAFPFLHLWGQEWRQEHWLPGSGRSRD